MTSSSWLRTELRGGPLYFFDQPARRTKWTRSNTYYSNGPQLEVTLQSNPRKNKKEGKRDDACEDCKLDSLNRQDLHPIEAYKQAAPHLLNELGHLLSQHKWQEERRLPLGIVNILNYSWDDLAAGAVIQKSGTLTLRPRRSQRPLKLDPEPPGAQEEPGERSSGVVAENIASSERETPVQSNPRVKKQKPNSSRAHNCTAASVSLSCSGCKGSGWIVQLKEPSYDDDPQWIGLCQWAVERLQAAKHPEKFQTAEQDLNTPLILRHYGDKVKDGGRKAESPTLVHGMPQIPEVRQFNPSLKKLHYRINDGSSLLYYPSGGVAVSQSHSGLPRGGFYTNVFSDEERPVILATITASGHGAVTHPVSSAITASWDQDGGFLLDQCGMVTKEWSWRANRTPREKIVIEVSDLISVRLSSGVSAMLNFRCGKESVQLPLSSSSNTKQMDLLQMTGEVEDPDKLLAPRRGGGNAGREIKRLQQRVQNILEEWLDFYLVAIGIKCPDRERMPNAPRRTRQRREAPVAALPSLNPPVPPEEGGEVFQHLQRNPTAPAEKSSDSSLRLPSKAKKELKVIVIGPLEIYGNIEEEFVTLPTSPDLQASITTPHPAVSPSVPLTLCPRLLRAAFLGEECGGRRGTRRKCCCSATVMPAVTDLEYDAFIMGQSVHSQQMLVVCVTVPPRQHDNRSTEPRQDALEELYKKKNKHRTSPCTQCQLDSFRLVRYEVSTGRPGSGSENLLLQQRHNVAPGMVLMYIQGKLLFVGQSCSVGDLEKQISKSRGGYRLGLSLPSDYKFSDTVNLKNEKMLSVLTRMDDISLMDSDNAAKIIAK